MKRMIARLAPSLIILCALLSAPAAAAPPPASNPKAEARKISELGLAAFAAGDYKTATDLFRQADERFHAVTLVLMQANSLAKLGYLMEAKELYQKVVAEALPPKSPRAFQEAQKTAKTELDSISQRIPRLRMRIKGEAPGLHVFMDGIEMPSNSLALPISRNPGIYTILVSADGYGPIIRGLSLGDGEKRDLDIEPAPQTIPVSTLDLWAQIIPHVDRPTVTVVTPPPKRKPEPSLLPVQDRSSQMFAAFTTAGLLLNGSAVAGVYWLWNNNHVILPQCDYHNACPSSLGGKIATAKRQGQVALATLLMGSSALGVGIALALTRKFDEAPTTRKPATILIGPGSLTFKATF